MFSLVMPASAAGGVYTVPKDGKTKAGVYENGKLLIAAKDANEVLPIPDAVRIGSSIFYTEIYSGALLIRCGGLLAEYKLKMKQGKSSVKTMKDTISNLTSGISTDGEVRERPRTVEQGRKETQSPRQTNWRCLVRPRENLLRQKQVHLRTQSEDVESNEIVGHEREGLPSRAL